MRASLLAVLSFVAGLGAACKKGDAAADDGNRERPAGAAVGDAPAPEEPSLALPVVGQRVRRGDLVLTVTTTGQVRSEAVARLKVEAAGTVEAVLVRPGDRVRRGQALVRLDPRPFDLEVQEAQAAVEEAQVRYVDYLVDSLVTGEPPSEERRRNALVRSGLNAAKVRLEKARLARERATITAPFEGVVDRVDVAVGERLGSGQDVATVVDDRRLRVEAAVLEHDLPLIRVGGEAVVATAAAPDRPTPGRVVAVLPLVDSTTRAGRAIVEVAGRAHGRAAATPLRPGMYADVRLEAHRLRGRVIVPAPAVIERDGRPLVFVVKEGRAQWTYITPGRSNGVETEVLPDSTTGRIPLAEGDTVLVEGHLTLTHDAPVRVVPAAGDGAAGDRAARP